MWIIRSEERRVGKDQELGRLQGCRWYDYMDIGGRTVPGATIESDAGGQSRRLLPLVVVDIRHSVHS